MSDAQESWWVETDDFDENDGGTVWVMSGDPDEPVIAAEVMEFGLDGQGQIRRAKLMAAAPDLLRVLQEISLACNQNLNAIGQNAYPLDDFVEATAKRAEAAIAKART